MKEEKLKEYIEKANLIHNNKFDYSKTNPDTCKDKCIVICSIHGEFVTTLDGHINGKNGCPNCAKQLLNTNLFIKKAKEKYGDKYDYSKSVYTYANNNICIICHEKDEDGNEHGEFWTRPSRHLEGVGCKKCSGNYKPTTEEWIEKAKKIHGDKYDYSKVKYKNNHTDVCIICHEKDEDGNEHGEFLQTPYWHLQGSGCPKCNGGVSMTKEDFIEKAKAVHGDKYDYSKVNYINAITDVCIICPRHGEFWQSPYCHTKRRHGCPKCKSSKLESITLMSLNKNNIPYIFQYKMKELGKRSLDFYLPNHNLVIECQGEQHYIPTNFGNKINDEKTLELFKKRQELDKLKYDTCKSRGYNVVYYTVPEDFHVSGVNVTDGFYSDKTVFTHVDDLMEYISKIDTTYYVNNFYSLFQELYSMTDDVICEDNVIKCKDYAIIFHPINENMDKKEKSAIDRYYRKRKLETIHIDENDFINDKEMLLNTLKSLINS